MKATLKMKTTTRPVTVFASVQVWVLVWVQICLMVGGVTWAQTEISSIDFSVHDGASTIEIKGSGELNYTQTKNVADNQFIVDIQGAKLGSMASRKLNTSSFDSPVLLVSPYMIGDGADEVRVVTTLKSFQEPSVSTETGKIVIRFAATASGSSDKQSADGADAAAPVDAVAVQKAAALPNGVQEVADENLALYMQSRQTKNFRGSPISLQVRDADVQDVFRLISEASGFNIILGQGVGGKITLSLVDVPWDQALDVVLTTLSLGAERSHNILRILTLANLTSEKKQQLEAKKAAEATAPLITRVYPISYAAIGDIAKVLTSFKASSTTGTSQGKIDTDKRTNSVIIQDIQENLDRMGKLIELLDTQTPQVLIESKIVEATEGANFTIGGRLGVQKQAPANVDPEDPSFMSFNGGNALDSLVSLPNATGGGTSQPFSGSGIAALANGGGAFGYSPVIGFLGNDYRLSAILAMQAGDDLVKVVSSPRTVVLNKEKAKILQSIPVLIPTTSTTETGTLVTGAEVQDANISLDVTPTVTNDENVLLDLKISRDVPISLQGGSGSGIGKRNIDTKVLVLSGSTLVIGGIYISQKNITNVGFPVLKDLPILGVLFGTKTTIDLRSELFIFVTPRILNTKKAGLTG